jgi:putative ABC transport system permease protein
VNTDWRRYVRDRLPPLDIPPEREIEIVAELALQLEAAYEAAVTRGLTESAAVASAEGEVPDWAALAAALSRIERPVAARVPTRLRPTADSSVIGLSRGGFMAGFVQDVRYAVRALSRAPGFAAVAIATLALGIGATTVVYSLFDGILLRPLPIADADRVVLARELGPDGEEFSVSWPNFVDWRERAKSFHDLAVWRGLPANLTGTEHPRRIMIRQVSSNLFDVLGVRPVMGRNLTPADDQPGVELVALVSYGFWQRELGGDTAAMGQRIMLNETPVTVVGVLPADFTVARQEDVFLPLGNFLTAGSFLLMRGNHNGLAAVGRLAPEATVESARAELATIAAQLAQEYPETNSGASATLRPLFEVLVSTARPMLSVLLGAVLAMLLIACVNLANLQLARSSRRAPELAVRRALGAESWRIGRQLLTESVLIGVCGGIAGVLLAWVGFGAIVALLPTDQPRVHTVALDARVLAVAAAVSILTGVLFGLLPALHGATGRSLSLLRSARVTGAASSRNTTRRALLLAEVALALVLLAGAGLMVRTMSNLLSIDPGFQAKGVISAQVSLPMARYNAEQRRAFYGAVVERARAIPGIVNAAWTISLPVQGSNWNSVFIVNDQPVPPRADLPSAAFTTVTPGYHETMAIPLLRGRLLHESDASGSPTVAVVNETFAKRFWPTGNAIGQRLKQGWPEDQSAWREIVGIVRDVKTSGIDQPAALHVYLPLAQVPSSSVALVARTRGDAATLAGPIEAVIHEIDPNLPVYDIRTLDEVIGRGVGLQRLTMVLLLGFAGLALVMAAVGVFGVTAYVVSQRTHELGVRMALGADRGAVLRLVLGEELKVCVMGIGAGIAGALVLSSVLETLLYDVAPRDPATLAIVSAVLIAVTALAGYFPARRATRIDPMNALRID